MAAEVHWAKHWLTPDLIIGWDVCWSDTRVRRTFDRLRRKKVSLREVLAHDSPLQRLDQLWLACSYLATYAPNVLCRFYQWSGGVERRLDLWLGTNSGRKYPTGGITGLVYRQVLNDSSAVHSSAVHPVRVDASDRVDGHVEWLRLCVEDALLLVG